MNFKNPFFVYLLVAVLGLLDCEQALADRLQTPSSLAATATTNSIKLSWKDSDSRIKTYFILRSEFENRRFNPLQKVTSPSTEFEDKSAHPNIRYYYKVRAIGGSATASAFSNIVSASISGATQPPLPPTQGGTDPTPPSDSKASISFIGDFDRDVPAGTMFTFPVKISAGVSDINTYNVEVVDYLDNKFLRSSYKTVSEPIKAGGTRTDSVKAVLGQVPSPFEPEGNIFGAHTIQVCLSVLTPKAERICSETRGIKVNPVPVATQRHNFDVVMSKLPSQAKATENIDLFVKATNIGSATYLSGDYTMSFYLSGMIISRADVKPSMPLGPRGSVTQEMLFNRMCSVPPPQGQHYDLVVCISTKAANSSLQFQDCSAPQSILITR
jgi:hypothetical protein